MVLKSDFFNFYLAMTVGESEFKAVLNSNKALFGDNVDCFFSEN